MDVKRIPQGKLKFHLKLGREIAYFLGTTSQWSQRCFKWIKVVQKGDVYYFELIVSIDEGNEHTTDVQSFRTANKEDLFDEPNYRFKGDWDSCVAWIKKHHNVSLTEFVSLNTLNQIYAQLVEEGKLGN